MQRRLKPLTDNQRRVLEVFRMRADVGLPPPTYRELCQVFGWGSTGTARDHIRALVQKGWLHPAGGRSRGVYLKSSRPSGRILPLVGRIVAGLPVVSEELVEREVLVPEELAPRGPAFLLRVSGESMDGAGILDGDIVVVRKSSNPQPGDIVAATVDGETTLKTIRRQRNKWLLVPANPRYPNIAVDADATIHGVVTALMRHVGTKLPHSEVIGPEPRSD